MRVQQRSIRFQQFIYVIAFLLPAALIMSSQVAFSQAAPTNLASPLQHLPGASSGNLREPVAPRPDPAAAAQRNVSGQWTDGFDYVWSLSQEESGEIFGTLTNIAPCLGAPWPVTGTVTGPNEFSLMATNTVGGEICVPWIQYDMKWTSSSTASGTYITGDASGGTVTMRFEPPVPINYQQVGDGIVSSGGLLQFNYSWESSSGDLADLTKCEVGENVTYPDPADPFPWPSPPYSGSSNNPTIKWVPATLGVAQDNQRHTAFLAPYVANSFDATQNFDYRCRPDNDVVDFPDWVGITIDRTVSDSTGRGCFGYTVTKSGASASIPRLPKVKQSACTAASIVTQNAPDFKNSSADISIAALHPETLVGLNAPILIDLAFLNLRAQMVGLDLGLDRKANLELTISQPNGDVITRTLPSAGFGRSGEISLKPRATSVERLLLNEWYEFPVTGTYHVKISLLDDASVSSGTISANRPATELTVKIGPRDPAQLESVSETLANAAIEGATLEESMAAANTLSYIRDPAAVASLVRVLQYGSLVETYAVTGLGRIGNAESVAALIGAQNHPDKEVRAAVRLTLLGLQGRPPTESGPAD
jgi:hypothetical protein